MIEITATGGTVRRAVPADAAALHELAAATFALACPPGTLEADIGAFIAAHLSAEAFARYLADPQRELFVAERPGASDVVDGYAMLVHGGQPDAEVAASLTVRPSAELSKLYVRAEAHGAGLAGWLVAATVQAARERGAAAVWLGVNQQNSRANRFYEKQGFALVGTKRFMVGAEWHDDFVRELVL